MLYNIMLLYSSSVNVTLLRRLIVVILLDFGIHRFVSQVLSDQKKLEIQPSKTSIFLTI